jgi:hypothetical protein
MDFKNYLIFGILSVVGSTLGWLISTEELSPKKIAAKGVAGLMIGMIIVPAFMPYFALPTEVWYGIIAISSVTGVEIIILLTKKLDEFIKNKIN